MTLHRTPYLLRVKCHKYIVEPELTSLVMLSGAMDHRKPLIITNAKFSVPLCCTCIGCFWKDIQKNGGQWLPTEKGQHVNKGHEREETYFSLYSCTNFIL